MVHGKHPYFTHSNRSCVPESILKIYFSALQDESSTIGYRTGNYAVRDGVVIIEYKEGDLLMMEALINFFMPILKQTFSKLVMLYFFT
jgi:hypothetical protein